MAVAERDEGAGRLLTEQLALAAAAAELTRLGAGHVAEAFVETRLGGAWRSTYGMLDARFDARQIVESALSAGLKLSGGPNHRRNCQERRSRLHGCDSGIERCVAPHLPRQQIAVHRSRAQRRTAPRISHCLAR
jgi:hypothetical protein